MRNTIVSKSRASTESFSIRLSAYSAAAVAALSAVPAAEADVQYITAADVSATSISFPVSHSQGGPPVQLDFTAGPFHGALYGLNVSFHGPFSASTGGAAGIIGKIAHASFFASQLAPGAAFAGRAFTGGPIGSKHFMVIDNFGGHFAGTHKSGYVAFKTGSYYGWLKVKVGFDAAHGWADQLSLVSNGNGVFGAFDKISSTAADNFTVGTAATPEPSTLALGGLALLAMGAEGVREQRRRKKR
jgi:hypothetical protein